MYLIFFLFHFSFFPFFPPHFFGQFRESTLKGHKEPIVQKAASDIAGLIYRRRRFFFFFAIWTREDGDFISLEVFVLGIVLFWSKKSPALLSVSRTMLARKVQTLKSPQLLFV